MQLMETEAYVLLCLFKHTDKADGFVDEKTCRKTINYYRSSVKWVSKLRLKHFREIISRLEAFGLVDTHVSLKINVGCRMLCMTSPKITAPLLAHAYHDKDYMLALTNLDDSFRRLRETALDHGTMPHEHRANNEQVLATDRPADNKQDQKVYTYF